MIFELNCFSRSELTYFKVRICSLSINIVNILKVTWDKQSQCLLLELLCLVSLWVTETENIAFDLAPWFLFLLAVLILGWLHGSLSFLVSHVGWHAIGDRLR